MITVLLGLPGTFRQWPRLREQPQRIADMELPPDVSEHLRLVYLYTLLG
jgi:hypothetical protein